MASRLFALEGAEVVEVDEEPGGGRTVGVVTAGPAARVCPVCRAVSQHVREQVVRRPADIGYGRDGVSVVWVKRRWECRVASCPRGTFTGSLPGVPPRCRVTGRLREQAGWLAAEGGMAYSFRNPASQRRRVRIACTRTARQAQAAAQRRSPQVTGRQPGRLTSKSPLWWTDDVGQADPSHLRLRGT